MSFASRIFGLNITHKNKIRARSVCGSVLDSVFPPLDFLDFFPESHVHSTLSVSIYIILYIYIPGIYYFNNSMMVLK